MSSSQGGTGAVEEGFCPGTWPGKLRVKGWRFQRGLRPDQKVFQEWSLVLAFDSKGPTVVDSVGEKQDDPGSSCQSGKARDQGNGT